MGGGGGVGKGGARGLGLGGVGWGVRVDVNKELNFFVKCKKHFFWGGGGQVGGVGLVGWVG